MAEFGAAHPSPGTWFLRVFVAFVRREARIASGYRVAFLGRAAVFALSVLTLAFMARLVGAASNPHLAAYGGDYLSFAVLGLLVLDLQQVGVTNLSQRVRLAQLLGLMEAELASPVPTWIALGVGPTYEFVLALGRATAYALLAVVCFGVRYPHASWTSVALVLPLMIGAFGGIGLLSAAVTLLVRRTNPVSILFGSASLLLSGVAYPVSVLPAPLRALGQVLPLTHALAATRGAMLNGQTPGTLIGSLLGLAVFSAVLLPVGAVLFAYALRRARVDGSLSHF